MGAIKASAARIVDITGMAYKTPGRAPSSAGVRYGWEGGASVVFLHDVGWCFCHHRTTP